MLRVPLLRRFSSIAASAPPGWPRFALAPEVRAAIANGSPVVALESTIISHGMPYPHNVATAKEVEGIVRSHGAIPATIALLDGTITVGLSTEQIEHLGTAKAGEIVKCSRRDLAPVIAQGKSASTTVASTMMIAEMCGINVFATGGIGGVHRGAETTFDISADLIELGRTPVAVVCAGVKSILDIPKTLEVLETQGVTVMGLNTKKFPAFFSGTSEFDCPSVAATPEEAAKAFLASKHLGLRNGMLVAVPNPDPADGLAIEAAIQQALKEAQSSGVVGRDVTPFILKRVHEITGGKSLTSNMSLIKENARVGAMMAKELSRLKSEHSRPIFPRNLVPAASVNPRDPFSTAKPPSASHSAATPRVSSYGGTARSPVGGPAPAASRREAILADDISEIETDETDSEVELGGENGLIRKRQDMRKQRIGDSLGPRQPREFEDKPRRGGYERTERPPRRDFKFGGDAKRSRGDSYSGADERDSFDRLEKTFNKFDRQDRREPARDGGDADFKPSFRENRSGGFRGRSSGFSESSRGGSGGTWRRDGDSRGGGGGGGGSSGSRGGGREGFGRGRRNFSTHSAPPAVTVKSPVVVGGAVMDVISKPKDGVKLVLETSNPGTVTQQFGGVGRNISEVLARLGAPVKLVSAVGSDAFGGSLQASFKTLGIDAHVKTAADLRTGVYSAMLNESGGLIAAVADMDVFNAITPEFVKQQAEIISSAGCVIADANLSIETLKAVSELCKAKGVPMLFEPTSLHKCTKGLEAGILPNVAAIFPNRLEVFELANAWRKTMGLPLIDPNAPDVDEAEQQDDESKQHHDSSDEDDASGEKAEKSMEEVVTKRFSFGGGEEGPSESLMKGVPEDNDAADSASATDDGTSSANEGLSNALLSAAQSLVVALAGTPSGLECCVNGRKHVFVKLGSFGVLALSCPPIRKKEDLDALLNLDFLTAAFSTDMDFCLYPAFPAEVVNVTGAGDSFAGGVAWGICQGWETPKFIQAGLAAAKLSVESQLAISPKVCPEEVSRVMEANAEKESHEGDEETK